MADVLDLPDTLQINAWTGTQAPADPLTRGPWAQKQALYKRPAWMLAPPPADPRDWKHPDIGWGLVLPDREGLSAAELARGEDAPEPIRRLLKARGDAPVLRYRDDLQEGRLRRYYPDRGAQDLSTGAPRVGVGEGLVPRYLLIYAAPTEIPWSVQYALNMSACVGRLDLTGDALDHYVEALLNDWAGCRVDPRRPVVWSTCDAVGDITWLMTKAVADKVWERYQADDDLKGGRRLAAADSTGDALRASLEELSPGLIVTTSHGMTGPLDDPDRLVAQLGAPVASDHRPIFGPGSALPSAAGAIWYAHACCSAGSDAISRFSGILPKGGTVETTMSSVATAAGARIAPLPRALLGAAKPLRAFVGHVEPTFDWTLRDPVTKQALAQAIVRALYDRLYQADKPTPIGFALGENYTEAGQFFGLAQSARDAVNKNVAQARDWLLYRQIAAMDRQTLVVLGDPTVALPLFG